jgi:hypothetical protein
MVKIHTMNCPKCGFVAQAKLNGKKCKFILYKCPCCNRNVVHYNGKVDILSDAMVNMLYKSNTTHICGNLYKIEPGVVRDIAITDDDVINLKILLNTETDSNKIIPLL